MVPSRSAGDGAGSLVSLVSLADAGVTPAIGFAILYQESPRVSAHPPRRPQLA
jgi:hypothetical protein